MNTGKVVITDRYGLEKTRSSFSFLRKANGDPASLSMEAEFFNERAPESFALLDGKIIHGVATAICELLSNVHHGVGGDKVKELWDQ